MPNNLRYQITSIKLDSGTTMLSAAKCPILVIFLCRKQEGPNKYIEIKIKKIVLGKLQNLNQLNNQKKRYLKKFLIFEQDLLLVNEDKGQLFINELVKPLKSNGQNQIMSQKYAIQLQGFSYLEIITFL
ncbi:unnamed protein product [Paramecium sonneborni]|uniref:Uncharacterized protein n=1 Tax=Paramecium sonneborni TaxID=65129 RepID=A0A8S1LS76_9CILI|nr:unnamed protein product [Paramecium sonneborni]